VGRVKRTTRENQSRHPHPGDDRPSPRSTFRAIFHGLMLIALGAVVAFAILTARDGPARRAIPPASTNADVAAADTSQPAIDSVRPTAPRTVWQLLALPDAELEKVDVIELNLAVVREIPGLEDLDTAKYQRIVDGWANQVKAALLAGEMAFRQSPEKWKNDVRFFRLGQVAGYLDQEVGIAYIAEQKRAEQVRYTDPGDLFLHGLIDTNQGTCGNMPTLHVAIGRRLGWPVSLAAVASHAVCRYDDGQVAYNIEATRTDAGGTFSAGTDEEYLEEFNLPRRAVTSGSDLHGMTARQMFGYFIAMRARHFADTGRMDLADRDYALARALLPNHRRTWMASMDAAILKGTHLFNPDETGHPIGLTRWLNARFAPRQADRYRSAEEAFAEAERINAINQLRMRQQAQPPGMTGAPAVPGAAYPSAAAPVNPDAPNLPNHTIPYPSQSPNPYGPGHPGAGPP